MPAGWKIGLTLLGKGDTKLAEVFKSRKILYNVKTKVVELSREWEILHFKVDLQFLKIVYARKRNGKACFFVGASCRRVRLVKSRDYTHNLASKGAQLVKNLLIELACYSLAFIKRRNGIFAKNAYTAVIMVGRKSAYFSVDLRNEGEV